MENNQEVTESQPPASIQLAESRHIGVSGSLPSFNNVFDDIEDHPSFDESSWNLESIVPSLNYVFIGGLDSIHSFGDFLGEIGTERTSGVMVAPQTGCNLTGGQPEISQGPGGSDTASLAALPDVVIKELVEEICVAIPEPDKYLQAPQATPDMATSDLQSDIAPSDFEPSDIEASTRKVQVVQHVTHTQLIETATTTVTRDSSKRAMAGPGRSETSEVVLIYIPSDKESSPLDGMMEAAHHKAAGRKRRVSRARQPSRTSGVKEAEIGDNLLLKMQWYYEMPPLAKVRLALARLGICATELLMRGVKEYPEELFKLRRTTRTQNPWWASNQMMRFVMAQLGATDFSQEGYKTIQQDLHDFSSTDAFFEHSLDHGRFSPCQWEQQRRAEKLRREAVSRNLEKYRCAYIVKVERDHFNQTGSYPVDCYRKGRREQSSDDLPPEKGEEGSEADIPAPSRAV